MGHGRCTGWAAAKAEVLAAPAATVAASKGTAEGVADMDEAFGVGTEAVATVAAKVVGVVAADSAVTAAVVAAEVEAEEAAAARRAPLGPAHRTAVGGQCHSRRGATSEGPPRLSH
jgi:hypothetical protein